MRGKVFYIVLAAVLAGAVGIAIGQRPKASGAAQSRLQAGVRGFVNPTDGKVREPEIEEQAAAPAADASPVTEVSLPAGGYAVQVPDEMMSYSVATVTAEGKVKVGEIRGRAKADSWVRRPAPAGKEDAHVR